MRGRWHVGKVGATRSGRPWLVLRGSEHEAVLWNGPVLELGRRGGRPARPRHHGRLAANRRDVARMRRGDQGREIGEALLDQRLVAGIGNMWRAEALFSAGMSPWALLDDVDDEELRRVLVTASRAMRSGRREHMVYRRAGQPCRRCGAPIESRRQGEDARTAYWCPSCQAGTAPDSA